MTIHYKINAPITTQQFITVLCDSGLAKRRPIHDVACIEGMIANSNLVVTAWSNHQLVGIARSVTDFHYACYLSDLAVAKSYQKLGIGKQLQKITQNQLGDNAKIILLAAPSANQYYERIGFTKNTRCWVLKRDVNLGG